MDLEELKSLLAEASSLGAPHRRSKGKPTLKEQQVLTRTPKSAVKLQFDLEEPVFRAGKVATATKIARSTPAVHHFGEQSRLEDHDARDKKERKKSLRFHTARIDSAQLRRTESRLQRGGDDDIPYPTRKRDYKTITRPETGNSDVTEDAADGKKKRPFIESTDASDEMEEEDGYYSLVKKQKRAHKEDKAAAYEAQKASTRYNDLDEGNDGPRSLTRAILANKGITAHRSKSVRNPRVKKRIKYDKAQKKVASQKAIYKGGPEAGKYGGEHTGISMRTVKSVKL